ncbi:MAG: ABC transporter ATP-binding protein [Propionibacteriaceae bacterium]|nr:ABC transporter ATP-binding protein [Propionibacteriaceae bacterium]
MDVDPNDPVALRAAARAERKTLGRLSRLIRSSLALVWSAGRRELLVLAGLQLLAAVALALSVLAVQSVLSAILSIEDSGAGAVVAPVLALAGLTAFSSVAVSVNGQLQRVLSETVVRSMWRRVFAVSTSVDLQEFESPDFYDRLNRVQTNAMVRPHQVTQGLLTMIGSFAASVGVGVALLGISPILLPLILLGGIPLLLTSRRESRLEFDFSVSQTPRMRLRAYLIMLQTGRDEAKEVRAFGLRPWLRDRLDTVYDSYLQDLRRHAKRRGLLSLIGQTGAAAALSATLLVLIWLIAQGRISVAAAGAAIVAIRMLATQVQALMASIQSIFESGLFLDDLTEFLSLGDSTENDTGVEAPAGFDLLRIEDVRFRYPGAAEDALRGVDVQLGRGEIVALVGENGSGKTTLAKLMAGLYQPRAGRILWDGQDTANFRPSTLRERCTVVFQDFVRYALSGTENIALGRAADEPDPERVRAAARAAGAERMLAGLPQGFDTILSRLFTGGVDLSGGQWQRVALARSFYRDAPLVILDEPSAALDPRAENELFTTLRDALHGRAALFISHRFSTVRGADRIYVLHNGQVVEHGTHTELMRIGGRYSELYRLQVASTVGDQDTESS